MSKMKPALGRGLASLIPRPSPEPPSPVFDRSDDGTDETIVQVPLEKVQRNPYQPRADFSAQALDELKRSIQEKGVIQPITVRRHEGAYQLISGERRVRAARAAGLRRIPAYVIRVRSDEEMLELALIENLQREHLNAIEVAISYRRLIEECQLTQEEVARRIGKDRSTVTNMLRLLKLPDEIQHAVRAGDLSGGHARALVALDDRQAQVKLFRKIIAKDLSVREAERAVRALGEKSTGARGKTVRRTSTALSSVEDRMRRLLGTRVHVRQGAGGKGEILIEYYSPDDLDRILEIFDTIRNS